MLPLMSHDEYADGTDGQTDGRQTVTLRFPLDDVASVIGSWVIRQRRRSLAQLICDLVEDIK